MNDLITNPHKKIKKCLIIFFLILSSNYSKAQIDSSGWVKYSADFEFTDGIYLKFSEFTSNNPSIKEFYIKHPTPYSDPSNIELNYKCPDSLKKDKDCNIKDCWGYAYKGDVYIAHSLFSYYFKLQVIGKLCHFIGISGAGLQNFYDNEHIPGFGIDNTYRQYMMDTETGEIILFNYKNFVNFLKFHDLELYKDLSEKRGKKRLIFQYLLKYNQQHPLYFPV